MSIFPGKNQLTQQVDSFTGISANQIHIEGLQGLRV